MELTEFIAAVDLGTSKIVGIVGTKSRDGKMLHVAAIEKEDSDSCIKRGCIQNVEEAATKVQRLISRLENRAKCKIGKIYVSLNGQSVQSLDDKVTRPLNEDTPITDQIIDSLKETSMKRQVGAKEIFDIVPSEYIVDGRKAEQPVGVYGVEIEATHKLIIGRPILKKNIVRMMEKIHLGLAGYILSPLAESYILSEPEKSLGCVLVDFGGGTTTVSIYKDKLLQHLAVIPLGGNSVTNDITSLQLMKKEAEKVKTKFGNADPEINENENQIIKHTDNSTFDTPEIQLRTLHEVILARCEEIIENISQQIKVAGFDSKQLSAGIILTGGGSNMKGLIPLLKKETDMDVKIGVFPNILNTSINPEIGKDPAYSVLLGLLRIGSINCRRQEETPVEDVTLENNASNATEKQDEEANGKGQERKFGRTFINMVKDAFTNDKDSNI